MGAATANPANAQRSQAITKAAVVIGVNRTGGLPPLEAAASGAQNVASWLDAEGFQTRLFTDASGPVHFSNVFTAVRNLVARGTLTQLVMYFAGHGLLKFGGADELLMLSDAPEDAREAILLVESARFARDSGIHNVVFISDACRSVPNDLVLARVSGGSIFPNQRPNLNVRTEVDKFLATKPGYASYEGPLNELSPKAVGYFTESLLDAFRSPAQVKVTQLPGNIRVILNRDLEDYLEREVPRRAAALDIRWLQLPDAELMSNNGYIARVRVGNGPRPTGEQRTSTVDDAARQALADLGLNLSVRPRGPIEPSSAAQFDRQKAKNLERDAQYYTAASQLRTGFNVTGDDRIVRATHAQEHR